MTHKALDFYENISLGSCPVTLHCRAAYQTENDELLTKGGKTASALSLQMCLNIVSRTAHGMVQGTVLGKEQLTI